MSLSLVVRFVDPVERRESLEGSNGGRKDLRARAEAKLAGGVGPRGLAAR